MESGYKSKKVARLDGHQLLAKKRRFGYCRDIEQQRRLIAAAADVLAISEQEALADGCSIEEIKTRAYNSTIDCRLGILKNWLASFPDVDYLMRDKTFIRNLDRLHSFDWAEFRDSGCIEHSPKISWQEDD